MSAGRPDAEIEIDERLVQALLSAQHPDLASYPIKHLDAGWDNAMFRLGDEHTVRLPRRSIAARLLVNEQTWRAKAWAVLFAAVLLDSGLINSPRHAASGRQAFLRISEDG